MISIVIPVKNEGERLVRCLDAIARQRIDDDVEVVVVDSGSTDGSPERARQLGARVHEIPAEEFNHGGTRNLGAELAKGDTLVFISGDAYPATTNWLATLVAPLVSPDVGGVYGRQLPHDDATPLECFFLDFLYGPHKRTQRLGDERVLSYEVTLFSNVNSAIRRETWETHHFTDDIVMSEDQEWSRRVLLAGFTIVYEPDGAVFHSHNYSIGRAFRHFFDSGASAERSYVGDGARAKSALWKAGVRYARGEMTWLWATGQRRWIPYATVYELAKFLGLQLGRRHRFVPSRLKSHLSGYPAYWHR